LGHTKNIRKGKKNKKKKKKKKEIKRDRLTSTTYLGEIRIPGKKRIRGLQKGKKNHSPFKGNIRGVEHLKGRPVTEGAGQPSQRSVTFLQIHQKKKKEIRRNADTTRELVYPIGGQKDGSGDVVCKNRGSLAK